MVFRPFPTIPTRSCFDIPKHSPLRAIEIDGEATKQDHIQVGLNKYNDLWPLGGGIFYLDSCRDDMTSVKKEAFFRACNVCFEGWITT